MIGKPIVDVTMDADQSLGLGSLDGRNWTRLSTYSTVTDDYVISVQYEWGRDRFITGDFQTGLATVVLDNNTGEFSPNSGVNAIGGDKLEPGMILAIGYYLAVTDVDAWVENASGDTWTAGGTNISRDIVDAETVTGFKDGATWTAEVATPGDIKLVLDVHPPSNPPALSDGTTWGRWMGRIIRLEDRYEAGGVGAVTVVTCSDFMADLAAYNPGALGVARAAEDTGNGRWDYIFTQALNDGNMKGTRDVGIYDVESSDLPSNYLEEARVAARAEGGAVYADHGAEIGRLVFKDANWLIEDPRTATVQAVIGDARLGIVSATTDYSANRVYNDLYYENSSTTKNESDATSIAAYSTRALRRTVLNNSNASLEDIAERDLAIVKDAKMVITSVQLQPQNIFEELFCCSVTVGDLLDVTIENDGWSYQQDLHVAGISERFNASTGRWTQTLRLDSRDGDSVLT